MRGCPACGGAATGGGCTRTGPAACERAAGRREAPAPTSPPPSSRRRHAWRRAGCAVRHPGRSHAVILITSRRGRRRFGSWIRQIEPQLAVHSVLHSVLLGTGAHPDDMLRDEALVARQPQGPQSGLVRPPPRQSFRPTSARCSGRSRAGGERPRLGAGAPFARQQRAGRDRLPCFCVALRRPAVPLPLVSVGRPGCHRCASPLMAGAATAGVGVDADRLGADHRGPVRSRPRCGDRTALITRVLPPARLSWCSCCASVADLPAVAGDLDLPGPDDIGRAIHRRSSSGAVVNLRGRPVRQRLEHRRSSRARRCSPIYPSHVGKGARCSHSW